MSIPSRQDRSKRFTAFTLYFPDRSVHSDAISTSLGSIQPYAAINVQKLHISTIVPMCYVPQMLHTYSTRTTSGIQMTWSIRTIKFHSLKTSNMCNITQTCVTYHNHSPFSVSFHTMPSSMTWVPGSHGPRQSGSVATATELVPTATEWVSGMGTVAGVPEWGGFSHISPYNRCSISTLQQPWSEN